jgi:hypothetical protein
VDPYPYVAACQYDRCHSTDKQSSSCRDLEAYARACMQAGLCLNWRTNASCPYECPKGKPAAMHTLHNASEIQDFQCLQSAKSCNIDGIKLCLSVFTYLDLCAQYIYAYKGTVFLLCISSSLCIFILLISFVIGFTCCCIPGLGKLTEHHSHI